MHVIRKLSKWRTKKDCLRNCVIFPDFSYYPLYGYCHQNKLKHGCYNKCVKEDLSQFLRLCGHVKKERPSKHQIVNLHTLDLLFVLKKKADLHNDQIWNPSSKKEQKEKESEGKRKGFYSLKPILINGKVLRGNFNPHFACALPG